MSGFADLRFLKQQTQLAEMKYSGVTQKPIRAVPVSQDGLSLPIRFQAALERQVDGK